MNLKTHVLLFAAAVFAAAHLHAQGQRPVAPKEPAVKPRIARHYLEDPTGRRITDVLYTRLNAATAAELNTMTEVELIFTEQVTQSQIDQFLAMGGEITYQYHSVSYGWNGRIALRQVRSLPQAMGPTLVLVKEPSRAKLHLYNATQTGRVRTVWTNFAGNTLGFDGNTNITIGIIDSGVDSTHTDLSGRQKYWKDWSGTGYATGTDYDGHGTHVAGIATGSGAAGGSASGPVYFTQNTSLTNAATGSYIPFYISIPSSTTWRAGAIWTNGSTTQLQIQDRFYFNGSYTYLIVGSATGTSPLSASGSISSSASDVYSSALIKTNVSSFVITNVLASYPASPDAFNRFRGVAPGCNWAAAKVFDDSGAGITTYIDNALDDFVTYRTNYNIKVINMSLGVVGSPGIDTTLRQKVNTAVQNGIIVVVAAGNDGSSSQVDDPGRAAYAITVGAMNGSNAVTTYTSEGFTSPSSTSGSEEDYKPDLLAPGGSDYTGYILSADSNNGDSTAFADQKANDYTPMQGTSMATPFVSGAAALVIDAMQQHGYTWDFNSADHPKLVKMLLSATATEVNAQRENNSGNPTLERASSNGTGYPASKDKYEGYGALNPDAAIEAISVSLTNGVTETNSLGGTSSSRRASARKISLSAYVPETFSLVVPAGGDFDLYLYSTNTGTYGAPIILASSASASTGTDEAFTFNPTTNLDAIVVVKRVSGSGSFSLVASNTPNNNFTNAYSLSDASSGYSPGNNTGYTTETGEPSGGGSGKTAWYAWTAPYTGKVSFMTTLGVVKMYTGTAVNTLTAVTSHYSNTASNDFVVTANTAYHISVDSTGGAYTLSWSYQGVSHLDFTNSTAISLPTSGSATPYGVTNSSDGVPGQIVSITTTIQGLSVTNFTYAKILLDGPTTNVSLKGFMGGSVAVTNLNLVFADYGTPMDFNTSTSGTYHPTDPLNSSVNYPSPAPSKPYSTNLDDFVGENASGSWILYVDVDGTLSSSGSITNWLLNITLASPPTIAIDTSTTTYSDAVGGTNLTSTATITDSDNWDFSGGLLTVQITNNAASEDKLFVNNQGTASGQIGVNGTVVSYSGTNFGYYTGGTGTTPLVVYFTNSAASFAAVQALFTRIAYTNTTVSSTAQRTVLFTMSDGLYGTNSVSKAINVTASNHAPTVANPISNQSATYGSSFTFTFSSNVFTDSDAGQTLTYTANSTALTNTSIGFNGSTRTFSATTIDATNGGTIATSYSVAVIATDNGSPAKSATNTFTLTINKTTASVTANNASRTYGATNAFTGSTSGFLGADSISAGYASTATTNSSPGNYTITPIFTDPGSRLGNYTVTTNTGSLTISKAPVTVYASNLSRAYGSTNPTLTVSYAGLTNGQTLATSDITGSPTLTTSATTNSTPGSYTITNTIGTLASGNYSLTMSNGLLTVTQAVLTVTATNVTRGYGGTNPVFSVAYSGFANGQTLANSGVTGSPTLTTSATTNSAAGSYVITNSLGTLTAANYNFALVNGNLTVTQAVLLVSADPFTRGYGATNPTFTVSYSGFTNGQNFASSGITGSPSLTTSATTNSNVGSYVITNSSGTLASANYSFLFNNNTLTITQAVVTVTATNLTRAYGATNPPLTVSYIGLTNGQTLATSGITGSPTLTTAVSTNSAPGNYVVTNSLGTLSSINYSFAIANGSITVTQAVLTVTPANVSRAYGQTNPILTGTITGIANNDNITAIYNTTASSSSPVGTYPITATLNDPGAKLPNYNVTTNQGVLTVTNTATVISFNFTGTNSNNGTSSPMAASESAGVFAATNWNSSTNQTSGSLSNLVGGDGVATTASITWSAPSMGSTATGNTAGDLRMMKGYIIATNGTVVTVTVTNLPSSISGTNYDVIVYFDGANGTANRVDKLTIGTNSYFGMDYTSYQQAGGYIQCKATTDSGNSTPPGNFMVFTNLTGNGFTITATPGYASDGVSNAPINGFQIIADSVAHTAITANPTSQSVCLGSSVSFTASAQSASTLTVQWQVKTNGGSSFASISSATNATYSFTPGFTDSNSQYQAVFTGTMGVATTTAATLTVNALPTATITTNAAAVVPNSSGNTAVAPSGLGGYAWTISNGTITSGTNSQTITFTAGSSGSITLGLTTTNASGCTATNSQVIPIITLSSGQLAFTNSDSVVSLATNVTKNYTFTDSSNGLAVVVSVTLTPYSSSNASPVFTLLDLLSGVPTRLGVNSGLSSGDGNWIDTWEGATFSASLVSASSGISTNSIQFGITGIGIRPSNGNVLWSSSATTNVVTPLTEALWPLDTNTAALASSAYSGKLRSNQDAVYQLTDRSGGGIVFKLTFTESVSGDTPTLGTATASGSQFQFSVAGTTGAYYIVQTATNLTDTNWTAVTTNTAPFTYTDTNTSSYSQRFYRVLAQ